MAVREKAKSRDYPRQDVTCEAGDTDDEMGQAYARLLTSPQFVAYRVIRSSETSNLVEKLDTPGLMDVLKGQIQQINTNDMRHAEGMLISQATALQTMFTRLAERASVQTSVPVMESLYKMAFRAQNQCRVTLETLSRIKNPPVYAKQANIGTHVQVNNGTNPVNARENEIQRNQLLRQDNGTTLDTLGTAKTSGTDSAMATVGEVHGTPHGDG